MYTPNAHNFSRPTAESYSTKPAMQQVGAGAQAAPQGYPGQQASPQGYAGHQYGRQPGAPPAAAQTAVSTAPSALPAAPKLPARAEATGGPPMGAPMGAAVGINPPGAAGNSPPGADGQVAQFSVAAKVPAMVQLQAPMPAAREQALEQRVKELEALVQEKDLQISKLQASLAKPGEKSPVSTCRNTPNSQKKLCEGKPRVMYSAVAQADPIDIRLEEFYNTTGSAIQFHRINRGFYRFGETIVALNIINHKLMARTEDGWNHGKFGPIEKFLSYYENIERQKAGIVVEA